MTTEREVPLQSLAGGRSDGAARGAGLAVPDGSRAIAAEGPAATAGPRFDRDDAAAAAAETRWIAHPLMHFRLQHPCRTAPAQLASGLHGFAVGGPPSGRLCCAQG